METKYDVTINEEYEGECEFSELIDRLVNLQPGDKIEIEVI